MLLTSTTVNGAVSNDSNNNITMSVGNTVIANVNSSGIFFESGKKAIYTGGVLQVVGSASNTTSSTTGTSYVASNVTATITPTSSSSKILIIATFWQAVSASAVTVASTLYRNSTDLAGTSYGMAVQYIPASSAETSGALHYLDSPATTSATTYTVYFKRADSAGTVYVGTGGRMSSITLLEIAG